MGSMMRYLAMFWSCLLLAEASPWRSFEAQHSQACGDKLADIMSLVCSGRGYNVAFRPERTSARRIRRGIVEECCRKSCSPAMLELYCRADPTDIPANVQIRKRSDSGAESSELRQVGHGTAEAETQNAMAEPKNTIAQENKIATTTTGMKEGNDNFKLLNLLTSSEHPLYKQNSRNNVNKPTPNDTTEEEFYKLSNIPLLRHHKNHRYGNRQFRGRKASSKTKREKKISSESMQTFQIGTVKPYFAGRALASYYVQRPSVS